jgi:molecular chaperone GrpE
MKKAEPETRKAENAKNLARAAPVPSKDAAAAPVAEASAPNHGQTDAAAALVPVEPATLTPEQLDELKTRAARADELWDRLLRTTADFDNFKKRAARERQDAVKFGIEALMQKLIPVLDNLEMAQAAAQNAQGDAPQSLQTGIAMIHQQFKAALIDAGLEEVDASGKPFDPNLHEAVSQQETHDVPEGHVVQQLRKGYRLRERLLRPATVVIAKHPAA